MHDRLMEQQEWDGVGRAAERSWRFLTLTMPLDPLEPPEISWAAGVLRRRIKRIGRAWSRFWRMTAWGRQVYAEGGGKRSRRDTSAIRAIEVGSKSGMVHMHVLVYGEYIDQARIQALWEQALQLPAKCRAIVHVQAVTSPEEGLREVFKYVTKGVGGDEEIDTVSENERMRRLANVELAFRSVHRISTSGAIRRVKVTAWDTAHEDVRPEDVHDHKVAACEDCGTVGDWKWLGPIDAAGVQFNGGFGLYRRRRTWEDVLNGSRLGGGRDLGRDPPGADQRESVGVGA